MPHPVALLGRRIESGVGLLSSWMLGITTGMGIISGCTWIVADHPNDAGWVVVKAVAIVLAGVGLWVHAGLFVATFRGANRGGPLGLSAALALPRYPPWLRPAVAFWWLLHFLVCVWTAFLFQVIEWQSPVSHTRHGLATTMPSASLLQTVLLLSVGLVWTFLGNTFLLLALSPYVRDSECLRRVWGFRLLLDVAVTLAAAAMTLLGVFPR